MAEHISEILAMGGVKKRNVEIKPTCSPSPCVHLTGPRCEVEDLKDSLKAFIQSLKTKECEVKGPGAQQFFQGLRRVFQLCEQNSFGSVALPVIGPGIVLSIPVKDAVNILTHEICKFLSGPTGQLHTICIPIMPNYPNSEEMFQTVRGNLSAEMVDSTGQAQVASGQIFTTLSGGFPCKTIMHVCGQRDPAVIKTLAKEIVVQCERGRCRSVAIPAICAGEFVGFAGQGGLDPSVVAKSILEGVKEAPAPLVPTNAIRRGRSATTSGHWASTRMSRSHSLPGALNLSALATSLPDTESRAVFLVIGYSDAEVSDACRELKRAYDNQCTTQTFTPDEMNCLTPDEMDQLLFKVDSLHLKVEMNSSEEWVVKGLKDGVNEVLKLTKDAALRQSREKAQDLLYSQVTWCILGLHGVWQKVPKDINFKLEKKDVKDGFVDTKGVQWTVDLQNMEATSCDSGQVTALKRLENLPDFAVPIYWDNMNKSETFKVIELDQSSGEYETVKMDFKRTVTKTVLKIQRIQNINLRRLYEVRKTELENRNDSMGAGEKILYHGTSKESCTSIMNTNFNRSLAGQNGNYGF
ncbi:poly [ADP-ribose] polymerase 14-like protein [Labeo rohita]|uniref:Poly [ADP-ribose] polymerase 14-like protein n=1 Tax=Labeo rohita TaxID=84645 RepID=A0A498LSC1_LABRO|nr:poly [ADP-ribose] polymerase 14-like protein [Labeo rohita]